MDGNGDGMLFAYTSGQMRKRELISIGVPRKILDDAAHDRAFVRKGYVHKLDPKKRNSPLMYDTAAFDAWYRKRINIASLEQARFMKE